MNVTPGSSFVRINQGVANADDGGAKARPRLDQALAAAQNTGGRPETRSAPARHATEGNAADRPRPHAQRGSLIDIKV
jgi:hypothetical protein